MGKNSRKRRERIEQVQKAREIEGLVKRARFFDEIQRAMRNPDTEDDVWWVPRDTPVITIQQAFEYVMDWQSPLELDDYAKAFASIGAPIKPPFDHVFFEWKWATKVHYGVYASFINLDNDDVLLDQGWRLSEHINPKTSFLLALCTTAGGIQGKFEGYPCCVAELDSAYGFIKFTNTIHNPFDFSLRRETTIQHWQHWAEIPALIATFAIQLMNVRNIVTVDHEPDPADNSAYQRHFGAPMTAYKTLAIKPMGKQYERDDQPQQQFNVMPLHLVRGHFMTHTPERPRFGKPHPSNIGTIFVPAHARGDAKNGIRVKDYELKTDAAGYEEIAKTADQFLSEMQQRNGEAFTALETAIKESQS